jgi:hypothetical protein
LPNDHLKKPPNVRIHRVPYAPGDVSAREKKMPDRRFKTLRGFLDGSESNDEIYFAYSATLRIFGEIPDLNAITKNLELQPTESHLKGERRGPRSPGYLHDMWSYSPPLDETEPLEKHIDALWEAIRPHKDYIRELKKTLVVDVFLGYRSNCDHAGVEIPHTSLRMFCELEIPFGLSIIIA